MTYVTGDIHGELSISRLNSKNFPEGKFLTKQDYVMICGDFGLIWNNSAQEKYWLKWLAAKPWTTLFVDGNHENHDILAQWPVTKWHGGLVHKINESVIHLMRGQIYDIDGKKWFTFGGAKSQDRECRTEGVDWWAGEMASEQEYEQAKRTLAANGYCVDYVVSHCGPTGLFAALGLWWGRPDSITNFLQYEVLDKVKFTEWYFGHYHMNRYLGDGVNVVYTDIRRVI